ncbi:MAG: hypothetical protein ABR543_16760, partial [Gemmatimonadaceae bacterium]
LFQSPELGERYMVISSIVPAPLPVSDPEAHPADGSWESGPVDLPRGETVLGWYRTRAAAGSQLSAEDSALHQEFFPDPWQIALILVPASERPAGSFYRLERKVNRSFITPFYELLHTRPRRDEAAKRTCIMWESYLTDEEIVPLEDRDVLSSASSIMEAEPTPPIAGDPALDWLEARLRSLWSRIRGAPSQGVNGAADSRPAMPSYKPLPPRRPPQPAGGDSKRTTPSRLSTLVSQPDPKIVKSKTPTKPGATPPSNKQATRIPPARSPMIDQAEAQTRRPTTPAPTPAVEPEASSSKPQDSLGKQLREALSAWDTEGGLVTEPRKTADKLPAPLPPEQEKKPVQEPTRSSVREVETIPVSIIQPPTQAVASTPVSLPSPIVPAPVAEPKTPQADNEVGRPTAPSPRATQPLGPVAAAVPTEAPSMNEPVRTERANIPVMPVANPLVVLPPDFEDRRSVTFFERHRNPILATGGAAVILFAILVVVTRPDAPPTPVIGGADSASVRSASNQPRSADLLARFDVAADSLDRAIAFYRTVHVDFNQRRLSCRAVTQSRAAVVPHVAALAQIVKDSGDRLNPDRQGRYDRLSAAAADVEKEYRRSGCERQAR